MKTVKALVEERQQLIHQQKDLYERAKKEERNLTNDELDQFEKMEADAADLRRQIDAAQAIARNHEAEYNAQEQRQEAKPEYNCSNCHQLNHLKLGRKSCSAGERALNVSMACQPEFLDGCRL